MKKFLFLFLGLFVLFSVSVSAQAPSGPVITHTAVGYLKSTPTHAVTDTLTNAVAKSQYGIINGSMAHVTVQATLVEISGTQAGTLTFQGSIDGLVWSTIGSAYTITDVASQTTSWSVTPSLWRYYRISAAPSGTQSTKLTTKVLTRRNL